VEFKNKMFANYITLCITSGITLVGDLNAKIRREDIYRPTTGKYSGYTKASDNGIRLINFASSQNMVTGGTMFDHKDVHDMEIS
jgi:hypothetical protein